MRRTADDFRKFAMKSQQLNKISVIIHVLPIIQGPEISFGLENLLYSNFASLAADKLTLPRPSYFEAASLAWCNKQ